MSAREDERGQFAAAMNWPGAQSLALGLLQEMIRRHAPIIRFHPAEAYVPAIDEW